MTYGVSGSEKSVGGAISFFLSFFFFFLFLFLFFLLDIFFIYISNAIPKIPYTLPLPCSPTHPFPLLGPDITLYWGI
jgi:dolichol kinase